MEEPPPPAPVESLFAGCARQPRFRFFRLVSFWLGLPVLIFLIWAWHDSMRHALVLNWKHGSPVRMLWPPVEKAPAVALSKITEPEPIRLPNAPGLSGEASPMRIESKFSTGVCCLNNFSRSFISMSPVQV